MKLVTALTLLIVLIAAAWYTLVPSEPSAAAGSPEAVEPLEESSEALPTRPQATDRIHIEGREETGEVRAIEPDAAVTLVVRVLLEPELEPLKGALVSLLRGAGHDPRLENPRLIERPTDAQGLVRFDLAEARKAWLMRVATGPRNAAHEEWIRRDLDAGEEVEVELRVSAGASLAGRVVDRDGFPVPSAGLRVWSGASFDPGRSPDLTGTADGAGFFQLAPMPLHFHLDATAPGLACVRGLRGRLAAEDRAEGLELVLHPAAWLEGTVVDPADRPVEGCELSVNAYSSSSNRDLTAVAEVARFYPVSVRSRSGADGRFRLGPVPAQTWNVRATHPHHPHRDQSLEPDRPDQVIQLLPGSAVVGRVLTHRGEPAPGARVHVRVGKDVVRRGAAKEDGRFELRGLLPGAGFLAVHAAGERVFVRSIEVREGEEAHYDVQLEPPLRIAGRVLKEDGSPSAGAHLRLDGGQLVEMHARYGEPSTLEWLFGLHQGNADGEGHFTFEDLPPGTYTLSAAPAEAPRERMQLSVRSGEEDLLVRLDRRVMERVVLMGRVFSAASGDPLRRFQLLPMISDADGTRSGRHVEVEDEGGRFRLAGFDAGSIELVARADGHATWRSGELELAEGEHLFEIPLHETRTVELELVDDEGAPLPRSTTLSFWQDERRLWIDTGIGSSSSSLDANAGSAVARGLPAAVIALHVHLLGEGEPHVHTLDLRLQPHDPVRVVVGVRPPFQVQCLFMATDHDGLVEWNREPRPWEEAPKVDRERLGYFDGNLSATFYSTAGRTLARASVRPAGEKLWSVDWEQSGSGMESPEIPAPHLYIPLPPDVVRMELEARGYLPRTFQLDRTSPNGGLPEVVFLRRAD